MAEVGANGNPTPLHLFRNWLTISAPIDPALHYLKRMEYRL